VLWDADLSGPALDCLVPLKDGTGPALFLAPPMTGGVLVYRRLVAHLGMDHPVYGLQSPGLGDGELPERTLAGMARRFVAMVQEVQPAGPLLVGGFSFGAAVADEMSRQLRDLGREVALVLMLDAHPFGGKPGWERDLAPGARGVYNRFRRNYASRLASRGRWWNLTRGSRRLNPAVQGESSADQVRQVNRLISAGYSYRRLEFPTALVDARKPGAEEVALPPRRVRAEVRRYPVVYEGASHAAFLQDPQAHVVAAAIDDAVAWALARSGDHA
jgi:thioesterase domain-containing protein